MRIPIIKPVFDQHEIDNITNCLTSAYVAQGPFVAKFEQIFAAQQHVSHAVAVTSCTAALHLALLALDLGPGDEVIVPSLTWVATANAVAYVGAKPVFADVISDTYTIDPGSVVAAITPQTRAIIAVHLFGLCADMDALVAIAKEHGLFLVEDAACALGSRYGNQEAGSLGDIGCFSFHPRKVITTGEGGMLTTNNARLAERIRILRNHGCTPVASGSPPWAMPDVPLCGYNYRMTDVQGAIGCAQMEKVAAILAERAQLATAYTALFADSQTVVPPFVPENCTHSWQSYVVRFKDMASRNNAAQRLANNSIETRPGTHAVHRLSWHAHQGAKTCPNAALCEDTSLALPLVHGMSREQQEEIVTIINAPQ